MMLPILVCAINYPQLGSGFFLLKPRAPAEVNQSGTKPNQFNSLKKKNTFLEWQAC